MSDITKNQARAMMAKMTLDEYAVFAHLEDDQPDKLMRSLIVDLMHAMGVDAVLKAVRRAEGVHRQESGGD